MSEAIEAAVADVRKAVTAVKEIDARYQEAQAVLAEINEVYDKASEELQLAKRDLWAAIEETVHERRD